jgi:hypothetical protein
MSLLRGPVKRINPRKNARAVLFGGEQKESHTRYGVTRFCEDSTGGGVAKKTHGKEFTLIYD